jgi:hypothetical protein
MKTTYKIILGFIFLLFVSCGSERSRATESTEQNTPTAPLFNEKEKIPPSIPNI